MGWRLIRGENVITSLAEPFCLIQCMVCQLIELPVCDIGVCCPADTDAAAGMHRFVPPLQADERLDQLPACGFRACGGWAIQRYGKFVPADTADPRGIRKGGLQCLCRLFNDIVAA